MPANLTPQYLSARKRFQSALTDVEKIEVLKEMIALVPKHKGTDKLRADLRSRLSKLQKQPKKKAGGRRLSEYSVKRQGAAQVTLVGAPNVGKSQIVASLTNVYTEVAPYPLTTVKPIVGMMPYEDIHIQLIDTPPITDSPPQPWLLDIIRNADMVLLIIDLSCDEVLEQIENVIEKLTSSRINLVEREPEPEEELEDEEGLLDWRMYKKTIIVANKDDAKKAQERLEVLRDLYSEGFPIISISAKEARGGEAMCSPFGSVTTSESGKGLDVLQEEIFKALSIIRVYTKTPGQKADKIDPIILPIGSTVLNAATKIHKEFANLRYAKLWGSSKFDGQTVGKEQMLEDGDIVEFHF